jgi:hypothetical protein
MSKSAVTYEVIQPANPLRAKVGPPRPTDPTLLARAEAAIHAMSEEYLGWVADDLAVLEAGAAELTSAGDDPARRAQALQTVYGAVHDIKGQGSTFDFALVTGVAASLCRYLERTREIGGDQGSVPADPEIVSAHVAALRAVIHNGIKGDGGPLGREVESGLAKAVERSLARAAGAAEAP